MTKDKKVQMSIMVTPSVYEYVEDMSYELGMSKSAYINMVLVNHKKGNNLLNALPEIAKEINKKGGKNETKR